MEHLNIVESIVIIGRVAVSYTHLDVYKRQGLNRANEAEYHIPS